jgi:hypothetical protein
MNRVYQQDYTTFERFEYQIRSSATDTDVVNDYDIIRQYIASASRFFSAVTNRSYVPYTFTHEIEYRPHNFTADRRFLWLPDDCFAISSITNTDGTSIASSQYRFRNQYLSPNYQLEINPNVQLTTYSSTNFIQRYEIAGIWGFHRDYSNAWVSTTTLDGDITDSATSITLSGISNIERLQYIKIGDEMMQITSSIDTPHILTVKRGVNGTTASAHSDGATVSYWDIETDVQFAVTRLAVGLYRTRHNAGSQLRFVDGTVLVEGDEKSTVRIESYLVKPQRMWGA